MANTVISTVITDAHIQAAEKAWLTTNGGIMEAIHATFVAGYEAAVNERAAAPSTAAGEEQAAQQCEEWALLLSEKSAHAATAFERIQLAADAVKLRDHARAFRALARSEKDEGK